MVNQIIQKKVDIFELFMKKYFVKEQMHYVYNIEVFKKILYDEGLEPFLESLKLYYFKNKHYYLTRNPINFNQFNTILRQIFNKNELNVIKKVKYTKSKYQVEYYISYEAE